MSATFCWIRLIFFSLMISGGIVLVLTMTDCCKIFTEPGGEKTDSVKEQCTTVIIIFDGIVRKNKKKNS